MADGASKKTDWKARLESEGPTEEIIRGVLEETLQDELENQKYNIFPEALKHAAEIKMKTQLPYTAAGKKALKEFFEAQGEEGQKEIIDDLVQEMLLLCVRPGSEGKVKELFKAGLEKELKKILEA
jgi:hypothetical protein